MVSQINGVALLKSGKEWLLRCKLEIRHEVIVLGAGPAGLNAAKYAANSGCDVALIDSASKLGGQYWRHTGNEKLDQSIHHNFDQGSLLIDAVSTNPRITVYSQTTIWSTSVISGEVILRTKDGAFITTKLVIATGAYDRTIPFPGWDIPGVMTGGAVQSLLKGHGVLAGKRIVVAGTGPFLLPVAQGVSSHGGCVVALLEAGGKYAWLRGALGLAQNPAKALEGLGYLWSLRKNKVEMRHREAIIAAHAGDDGLLESVTVARIDAQFQVKSRYNLKCDVAAITWGFTPDTSLAGALNLTQVVASDGSVIVSVNDNQRAIHNHQGVEIFAAGEITGVGGSGLALIEGAIAGLAASNSLKNIKKLKALRRRAARFARVLEKVYRVPAGWKDWLTPDTIICRCEEVSYQEICNAQQDLNVCDAKSAKLMTRSGMGMCQGRICSRSICELMGSSDADRVNGTFRPIISPITLGELAAEGLL